MRSLILTGASVVIALAAVGCGNGRPASGQSHAVNPPPPTPQSPRPGEVVQSLNDAITKATEILAGRSTDPRYGVAGVTSLVYIQTTVGKAEALGIGNFTASSVASVPAWLFIEHGVFQPPAPFGPLTDPTYARAAGYTPEPPMHTLWILAAVGYGVTGETGLTDKTINLTTLGTPVVIPPGQIPAIDAVRARAAAAATPTP